MSDKALSETERSRSPRRHAHSPTKHYAEPLPPTTTRLYVGNLPFSTTQQAYEDLLTPFGKIVTCELIQAYGRPKGCGTVEYEDMEGVNQAMQSLNNSSFGGRSLFVREVCLSKLFYFLL